MVNFWKGCLDERSQITVPKNPSDYAHLWHDQKSDRQIDKVVEKKKNMINSTIEKSQPWKPKENECENQMVDLLFWWQCWLTLRHNRNGGVEWQSFHSQERCSNQHLRNNMPIIHFWAIFLDLALVREFLKLGPSCQIHKCSFHCNRVCDAKSVWEEMDVLLVWMCSIWSGPGIA